MLASICPSGAFHLPKCCGKLLTYLLQVWCSWGIGGLDKLFSAAPTDSQDLPYQLELPGAVRDDHKTVFVTGDPLEPVIVQHRQRSGLKCTACSGSGACSHVRSLEGLGLELELLRVDDQRMDAIIEALLTRSGQMKAGSVSQVTTTQKPPPAPPPHPHPHPVAPTSARGTSAT